MLNNGALAVAIVQRQIMLVQATQSHSQRDRWVDVDTYAPFGNRIFIASDVPHARIPSSDILSVFPTSDHTHIPAKGMLELPQQSFFEFMELSNRNSQRFEKLWTAWDAKLR